MAMNPYYNNLFRFTAGVFIKKLFLFICFTGAEEESVLKQYIWVSFCNLNKGKG